MHTRPCQKWHVYLYLGPTKEDVGDLGMVEADDYVGAVKAAKAKWPHLTEEQVATLQIGMEKHTS